MRKPPVLAAAALAALSLLSACNQEPEVVGAPVDRQGEALRNHPLPTTPPPSVVASRVYRCADNSVVYIDFLNNKTAALRKQQNDIPTQLTASEDTGPYAGGGFTVSTNAETIQFKAPNKAEQRCRANDAH